MATNRAELRRALDELRGALGVLESDLALDDAPQAAVQDLAQAVTGIRGSVWEFLKAEHADDYDRYLGKIQLRRAIEILEDVLSDLYADTLAPNTPGLRAFQSALQEFSKARAVSKA